MTEEEFLRLPDEGRKYELVQGEAKNVPTSFIHDIIGGTILGLLKPHTKGRGFVTLGQAGFRMVNGNIRCPDLSFTRKERLPDGKPGEGFGRFAPDFCVEIISPSEDTSDMAQKVREYFAAGARLVWQVFPATRRVIAFTSPTAQRTYEENDDISAADILPDFHCRVSELLELE